MPAAPDDWRRTSPGAVVGTAFRWQEYVAPKPGWDHDHCVFCWAKFVPRSEQNKEWLARDQTIYFEGYATMEPSGSGFDWVCRPCFDDFGDELEFVLLGDGPPTASQLQLRRIAFELNDDMVGGMYTVDRDDRVFAIEHAPPPSAGPDMARVVGDERCVFLTYMVAESYGDRGEERADGGSLVALCQFVGAHASFFGGPNDEALTNHPLYSRGLGFYGVFGVENSSWIKALDVSSQAYPAKPLPRSWKHFIVTMKEGIFECAADDVIFDVHKGSTMEVAAAALARLRSR